MLPGKYVKIDLDHIILWFHLHILIMFRSMIEQLNSGTTVHAVLHTLILNSFPKKWVEFFSVHGQILDSDLYILHKFYFENS